MDSLRGSAGGAIDALRCWMDQQGGFSFMTETYPIISARNLGVPVPRQEIRVAEAGLVWHLCPPTARSVQKGMAKAAPQCSLLTPAPELLIP